MPSGAVAQWWRLSQLEAHGLHALGHPDLDNLKLPLRLDHAELAAALEPRLGNLLQTRDALAAQILPQIVLAHVHLTHGDPVDPAVADEELLVAFVRPAEAGKAERQPGEQPVYGDEHGGGG